MKYLMTNSDMVNQHFSPNTKLQNLCQIQNQRMNYNYN